MSGQFTIRFKSLYESANIAQKNNGLSWYRQAYDYACELSRETDCSIMHACAVLSALSPNNKWTQNKRDARKFLINPALDTKVCTFTGQRDKAIRTLFCDNIDDIKTILAGKKTIAFFENIYFHDTSENVTVDIWVLRAAKIAPEKQVQYYDILRDSIKRLAKSYNIKPHQFQAVVWNTIRESK